MQSPCQHGAGDWGGRVERRENRAPSPTSRENSRNAEPGTRGGSLVKNRPLLAKQVWANRARLELADNLRDLALFNVAIDSKWRGCDLAKLAVSDLVNDDRVRARVSVIQSKTKRPVQFELTENTPETVLARVKSPKMFACRFMFPSRFHDRQSGVRCDRQGGFGQTQRCLVTRRFQYWFFVSQVLIGFNPISARTRRPSTRTA
jgi:hypothetical protein